MGATKIKSALNYASSPQTYLAEAEGNLRVQDHLLRLAN